VLRNVTGGKANVRHSAEFSIDGFRYTRGQRDCAQKTPWVRESWVGWRRHRVCLGGYDFPESVGVAHGWALNVRAHLARRRKIAVHQRR